MNDLTRRGFISGAAAAAVLPRRVFAVAADSPLVGTPRLRFGVISDIHIHRRNKRDLDLLKKVLRYFKSRGAEAVMMPGDLSDDGSLEPLVQIGEVWDRVFGSAKVEKLFIYGNHDLSRPETYPDSILKNPAKAWEQAFHEPFSRVWYKNVKGYSFMGCHWYDRFHSPWFLDSMREHIGKCDPKLPFFYIQHAHVKDTCFGSWADGADDGTTRSFFNQHPNAVMMTGHSHYSLTDEHSIWQGEFTALNTGSLSYTGAGYNLRSNVGGNSWGYTRLNGQLCGQQARFKGEGNGHQGLFVTLTDEAMRLERREFKWDEALGPDWVVPLTSSSERPYAYAVRAKRRVAPEFPADAKVSVSCEDGIVKIAFPAAETRQNCRVFEYELLPILQADGIEWPLMTRRILAEDFNVPQSQTGAGGCFELRESVLPPEGRFRFEVRPVECFGKKGAAISSAGNFSPRDTAATPVWNSVRIAEARGSFAAVDWSKLPERDLKVYPKGVGEPAKTGWKWGYRLANDGEWCYLELLQHRDSHETQDAKTPGIVISPDIGCFDTWELTLAAQTGMPYRYFLCGPDGRMQSSSYGEIDGRLDVPSKESGKEHWGVKYASDISSGNCWRARWAFPLSAMLPRPLRPGDSFYLNPASVLHAGAIGEKSFGIFSPVSYSSVRTFDRMLKINLAQ